MKTETPRPFGWWWQKFLRGVPHPDDATFNEFEDMFFEPTRGFMCWMLTGGMRELFITKFMCWMLTGGMRELFITKCCGDGAYWRDKAFEMFRYAKEHYGVKYMIASTRHNPEAFSRLFKCELWKTEERHGKPLYWFRIEEAR